MKISISEARENLMHYNLFELKQEAERFEVLNIETLSKNELIEEILKITQTMDI